MHLKYFRSFLITSALSLSISVTAYATGKEEEEMEITAPESAVLAPATPSINNMDITSSNQERKRVILRRKPTPTDPELLTQKIEKAHKSCEDALALVETQEQDLKKQRDTLTKALALPEANKEEIIKELQNLENDLNLKKALKQKLEHERDVMEKLNNSIRLLRELTLNTPRNLEALQETPPMHQHTTALTETEHAFPSPDKVYFGPGMDDQLLQDIKVVLQKPWNIDTWDYFSEYYANFAQALQYWMGKTPNDNALIEAQEALSSYYKRNSPSAQEYFFGQADMTN